MVYMTTVYCKKWEEGIQTAITRTLLTPEMLTKTSTATCTWNQEHLTILLEQYRWWSKVSCTIYIIYTWSKVSLIYCNILLLYKNLAVRM
jgi:hypothetical protein